MSCKAILTLVVAAGLTVLNAGCPFSLPPPDETLNNLDALPDPDGDGFKDLESPEGLDEVEMIAVGIVNEISRADAEAVVEELYGSDIPDILVAMVDVRVNFSVTRIYEGIGEFTDTGWRGLETFEIMVEAECPDTVTAEVEVVASAPFVPPIVVLPPQEFVLTAGDGTGLTFACGKVIMVTAFLGEGSTLPEVDIVIEDQ